MAETQKSAGSTRASATAESAALVVAGSLLLSRLEGTLTWAAFNFKEGLVAACRAYCMNGLTLARGFIGLLVLAVLLIYLFP